MGNGEVDSSSGRVARLQGMLQDGDLSPKRIGELTERDRTALELMAALMRRPDLAGPLRASLPSEPQSSRRTYTVR